MRGFQALRGGKPLCKRKRDQLTPKSDSDSDDSVFRKGSSSTCTNRVEKVARENPRALFGQGLAEISKFLGELGGEPQNTPRMLACLNSIFHGRHSVKDVGIKTAGEMRTLPQRWTP